MVPLLRYVLCLVLYHYTDYTWYYICSAWFLDIRILFYLIAHHYEGHCGMLALIGIINTHMRLQSIHSYMIYVDILHNIRVCLM